MFAVIVLFAGVVVWGVYGGPAKATVRFSNSTSSPVAISECLAYNDEVSSQPVTVSPTSSGRIVRTSTAS
jgi:hypothetical protein